MPGMEKGLPAEQRGVLAVDTSDRREAKNIVAIARDAGAPIVKLGLELSSAESWKWCSKLAADKGREWVADAKIDDIPATTKGIIGNLLRLDHPPVGITIHTKSGVDSMRAAQELVAEQNPDVTLLAVTHLTSIDDAESVLTYGFLRRTIVKRRIACASEAGIGGAVSSGKKHELALVANKISMIPGTRSLHAVAHDQKNPVTPELATANGADYLVLGRQVTGNPNPPQEYAVITNEINNGLIARGEAA